MHQAMQQENATEEPADEEPADENAAAVDDMPELLDMQQLKQLSEQYIAGLTSEQTPGQTQDTALLAEDLDQ